MHSSASQWLADEQTDQMGHHEDGNDDTDHLYSRIRKQRYLAQRSLAAFLPVSQSSNQQRGNENGEGCHKRHLGGSRFRVSANNHTPG